MSQRAEILSWLKRKPITALDAMKNFGCMRLAPRILELRQAGWPIETEIVTRNGKRFAKYFLER